MIVVDTNVISYLYLTGERSAQAEQALRQDPQWAAPSLWRSEFCNVLASYVRRQTLSLEEAQRIIDEATNLIWSWEVVSAQVLSLAAKSACSAYDCEFVALAQDLNVPLVTVDKQVLGQFPDVAVSLQEYVS
jgi:predicted nucleic acid-binding protein